MLIPASGITLVEVHATDNPTLQCHLSLEICIAQPVMDANEVPGPSFPPVPMRL